MTDGHRFVDADENVLAGKAEVLKVWEGFFTTFPDYRNDWSRVIPAGGTLIALGRSVAHGAGTGRFGDLGGKDSRREGVRVACL